MDSRTKTLIYVLLLAIVLGVALALFLWYGYLEKQRTGQSFDSVFASYSPQGSGADVRAVVQNGSVNPTPPSQRVDEQFSNTVAPDPVAERVSEAPVGAGSDIVGDTVRYIDRAKGYIYQTNLSTGKTDRISSALFPGAFVVQFITNDTAFIQTIDDNDTVIAHTLTFAKDATVQDVSIPLAIQDVVIRKNSPLVYALVRTDTGGTSLVSFTAPYNLGVKPDILWTSSLSGWRLGEGPGTSLLLQQKPSNSIPGYAYTFNIETNALTKIEGDVPGLMVLSSPTGKALVTTAEDHEITSFITHIGTNSSQKLSRVTFPEKCVWEDGGASLVCGFPKSIPVRDLPDIWHRGEFVFDDILGRVNVSTGEITEIETKLDQAVDMIDLKLTENGSTLLFTDKTTGTLWTIKNLK